MAIYKIAFRLYICYPRRMNLTEEQKISIQEDYRRSTYDLFKMKTFADEQQKSFSQLKLVFISILGVIFPLIFQVENDFDRKLMFSFIILTMFAVILLIIDMWISQFDIINGSKKQIVTTTLKKIRAIADLDDMPEYGARAEEIIISGDRIRQSMRNKESITSIITVNTSKWAIVSTVLWSLIILSVPFILLLQLLHDWP